MATVDELPLIVSLVPVTDVNAPVFGVVLPMVPGVAHVKPPRVEELSLRISKPHAVEAIKSDKIIINFFMSSPTYNGNQVALMYHLCVLP